MTELLPPTRRARARLSSWTLAAAVLISTVGCGSQASDAEIAAALAGPEAVSSSGGVLDPAPQNATAPQFDAGTAAQPKSNSETVDVTAQSNTAHGSIEPTKSHTPTSGTAGSAAAPAVANKSVVKIGQLGVFSGVLGAITSDGPRTLAAWATEINSRGGLNGHPVKIILGDDGGDPATGLTLARRMVESDKIIAMVATVVVFGFPQLENYMRAKNVPIIGTETADPAQYTSPVVFPTAAEASVQIVTSLKSAIEAGTTKIGFVYCLEVAALCTHFKDQAEKDPVVGKHIAESYQVSLVAPSYTSQCIRMQQGGIDYIFMAMDTAGAGRLVQDCKRQGFEPRTGILGLDATAELPKIPVLANTSLPGATLSPGAKGVPAVDTYRAVMKQYAATAGISGIGSITWSAAKMFELVTSNLSETPTSAEVIQNLWKVRNETLGGLTVSLTYTKGQPPSIAKCVFIWGVANQQYSAPQGNRPTC